MASSFLGRHPWTKVYLPCINGEDAFDDAESWFEEGGGWDDIYEEFACSVERAAEQYHIPVECVVLDQVKEKFGGLRIYWSLFVPTQDAKKPCIELASIATNAPLPESAAAFASVLQGQEDISDRIEAFAGAIANAVREAEEKSEQTCISCGDNGTSVHFTHGYIIPLCSKCDTRNA